MIIDKSQQQNQPDAAPPPYDLLEIIPSSGSTDTKQPLTTSHEPSSATPRPPPSPVPFVQSPKGKGNFFSLNKLFPSRATRNVRNTVQGLVQDLVRENNAPVDSEHAALFILRSCADACKKAPVSFAELLQEKYIGDHTPIYWAILHRQQGTLPMVVYEDTEAEPSPLPDLVTALLYFSRPITPATVEEIRAACLPNSDQTLFQRLQFVSELRSLSEVDKVLLNCGGLLDYVTVENQPGDAGEFVADLEIVQFQKRMRVAKRIEVQFIARGTSLSVFFVHSASSIITARLWQLAFWVVPDTPQQSYGSPKPGSWCLSLSLLASTSATYIDSRLLVAEPPQQSLPNTTSTPSTQPSTPNQNPSPSTPSPTSYSPTYPLQQFFSNLIPPTSPSKPKPRPTISLRLKSDKMLAVPSSDRKKIPPGMEGEIFTEMEASLMASSLQYA